MSNRLYLPVYVDWADDPRLEEAGEAAEVLLLRARCVMKEKVQDGTISDLQLRRLGLPDVTDRAARLVDVGIWSRIDVGYFDPRFLEENPTAVELENSRERNRDGARLTNHRRWHEEKGDPDCRYCSSDRSSDGSTDRSPVAKGREGEEKRKEIEGKGTDDESTDPAPDPSLSSPPPPSPDLATGYLLMGQYMDEMSSKQQSIVDEWVAERDGQDWLAAIAATAPDDFYGAVSQEQKRWRTANRRRSKAS